jgi:hypothetical protein
MTGCGHFGFLFANPVCKRAERAFGSAFFLATQGLPRHCLSAVEQTDIDD